MFIAETATYKVANIYWTLMYHQFCITALLILSPVLYHSICCEQIVTLWETPVISLVILGTSFLYIWVGMRYNTKPTPACTTPSCSACQISCKCDSTCMEDTHDDPGHNSHARR